MENIQLKFETNITELISRAKISAMKATFTCSMDHRGRTAHYSRGKKGVLIKGWHVTNGRYVEARYGKVIFCLSTQV